LKKKLLTDSDLTKIHGKGISLQLEENRQTADLGSQQAGPYSPDYINVSSRSYALHAVGFMKS